MPWSFLKWPLTGEFRVVCRELWTSPGIMNSLFSLKYLHAKISETPSRKKLGQYIKKHPPRYCCFNQKLGGGGETTCNSSRQECFEILFQTGLYGTLNFPKKGVKCKENCSFCGVCTCSTCITWRATLQIHSTINLKYIFPHNCTFYYQFHNKIFHEDIILMYF